MPKPKLKVLLSMRFALSVLILLSLSCVLLSNPKLKLLPNSQFVLSVPLMIHSVLVLIRLLFKLRLTLRGNMLIVFRA